MGIVQTYVVDPLVEKAKAEINAWITATLEVVQDFVLESSYAVALIGGGTLALIKGFTGSRTAAKWFLVIQLGNVLIKAMLGEAQW